MSGDTQTARPSEVSEGQMQRAVEQPPRYVAPPEHRTALWGHVLGIAGFSAILLASCVLDADRTDVTVFGFSLPPLCMWKRTWGIDCPGCGLTRCFVMLGHGRFADAWALSPAGILFYGLVAAQVPLQTAQLVLAWKRRPNSLAHFNSYALVVVAALLILQWGARIVAYWF